MTTKPHARNASFLATTLLGFSSLVSALQPCDIYASGGTPCVAAHSTTRSLYEKFNQPLYQLRRNSDDTRLDVKPLSVGGVANGAAHDTFCSGTTCLITIIYDQSGQGNHLRKAPPGSAANGTEPGGYDNLASGGGAPVTLNGKKAYGVFVSPGTGYRNNDARGTAKDDQPEGMYAVLDGTHFNGRCCFDYGNVETDTVDSGGGRMETIYFGLGDGSPSSGSGSGPWIMADLENGLFTGYDPGNNPGNPTLDSRFVTAVVKGEPHHWSIRGGNAASGALSTFYDGQRPAPNNRFGVPNSWDPMRKQGAIVLGVGGDNSNKAQGTFYEGVLTSGYPSSKIEDAVQANIIAAKYAIAPLTSGPALSVGSSISIHATTSCCTKDYLTQTGNQVTLQVVNSGSSAALKKQASWIVRTGLGNAGCFSFESKNSPNSFIRHSDFQLHVDANDGSKLFSEDATFCPQLSLNGKGTSFRSWSIPTHWWRHYAGLGYLATNGGVHVYDSKTLFNDDISWVVSASFA